MLRSKVETYKYRVGKNTYIVININQLAAANAEQGNALASNALNVQIMKKEKKKKKKSKRR